MRDPLEGLSDAGTIRTGADADRVAGEFRSVHDHAVALIHECVTSASVYGYGSVVTGQARVGVSDVDLLTVGLQPADARQIAAELSSRFAHVCRGVEISTAHSGDFLGAGAEAFGNRVFLRHYCVLLAGPDVDRSTHDFAGDRRAARGFNGDIALHVRRWRTALEGDDEPGPVAQRMARKSLLAVAGLVSVHDHTWTTDRETGAVRWGEIVPRHGAGLAQLLAWTTNASDVSIVTVREVLDGTVSEIVASFQELIGLWPDPPDDPANRP